MIKVLFSDNTVDRKTFLIDVSKRDVQFNVIYDKNPKQNSKVSHLSSWNYQLFEISHEKKKKRIIKIVATYIIF